jgi:hypothetical protein
VADRANLLKEARVASNSHVVLERVSGRADPEDGGLVVSLIGRDTIVGLCQHVLHHPRKERLRQGVAMKMEA